VTATPALKRQLGLAAVVALVAGNMLGSGVFFTPGELAAVAQQAWQVHFIWALSGIITLCGALTLAELCSLLPQAGASYHIIREGYGPFWGFLQVWLELWVTGPGAIAGIAIVFGEFMHRVAGGVGVTPVAWGIAAIVFFALINLAGVQWGGRTQVLLTTIKVLGIAGLVVGGLVLAAPAPSVARRNSWNDFCAAVRLRRSCLRRLSYAVRNSPLAFLPSAASAATSASHCFNCACIPVAYSAFVDMVSILCMGAAGEVPPAGTTIGQRPRLFCTPAHGRDARRGARRCG